MNATKSKSEYLHETSNDSLYVVAEKWESDMQFYTDEIRFFNELIKDHFLWIINNDHLTKVEELNTRLSKLSVELQTVYAKIKKHLEHLSELDTNEFAYDEQKFREEHQDLESKVVDFNKSYRKFKKDLFETVKDGINKEKLQYLQKD